MERKKKIFFLSPGPKYNLDHVFKKRCEMLSENFRGAILTAGPKAKNVKFGDFDVTCISESKPRSVKSTVAFILIGFKALYSARRSKDPFDLFVTYDPLKTGLIASILCLFFKAKLVVEVNSDYTDDVVYWDIENKVKRAFKKFSMLTVERFVLNRSDGIKVLFDSQLNSFLPLARKPVVRRFPDYVEADRFQNLGEQKIVLFAGFPFWIKGVDILIEAFKRVANKHPEWKLKILGFYPDKVFLDNFIEGHSQIFHQEPVDPEYMPDHIGTCGIFVLPSRSEAMGRVLIESMAAGKPRVGARVGGIPTVIRDEVDGLLFQAEDAKDLSRKLDLLMSNQELREELGQAAKARYEAEFRPEHYFVALNDFYSACCESNS